MQRVNAYGLLRPCAIVLYCLWLWCGAAGCSSQQPANLAEPVTAADAGTPAAATEPGVEREIRGLFVATAYNTDWPSRPGLDALVAEDEIRAILDRAEELNCNTIFLQVRSFGDRIYKVTGPRAPAQPDPLVRPEIPWSVVIDAGQHDPGYDPLEKWITLAHERGLELHAWVNPFRIDVPIQDFPIYDGRDGFLYMNPTSEGVQQYVMNVIDDLLQNYGALPPPPPATPATAPTTGPGGEDEGLDGIIVDHYYPDPDPPEPATQPTQPATTPATTPAAASAATTLPARRKWILKKWLETHTPPPPGPKTLTNFITTLAQHTHDAKGRFGVSPVEGQQELVTDWLPVVDYIAPEIYRKRPEFVAELDDWVARAGAASPSPLVVPVLYTSRVQTRKKGEVQPWPRDEIDEQIKILDGKSPKLSHIHYSYHAMRSPAQAGPPKDNNIGEKLKGDRYKDPAAPHGPTTQRSDAPTILPGSGGDLVLSMPGVNVRYWVIRRHLTGGDWEAKQKVQKRKDSVIMAADIPAATYDKVRVWAIDNRGQQSQHKDKSIP